MKLIFGSVLLVCFIAAVIGVSCDIDGHKFQLGESYAPRGECQQYTCAEDGSMDGLGCGSYHPLVPGACKYIPVDLSKPYPYCCEQYDCENELS